MSKELIFKELFNIDGRGLTENDVIEIMNWLISAGIDITDEEEINDNHYEPTWDYMFDWIHEGKTPSEIREEPEDVDSYNNVYVCEDGGCIFFYGIG